MLHGGLANSQYWALQVAALSVRFKVTVLDTRGHGRSPMTSPAFRYDLFASDTIGVLNFLGINKTALIGWSDGAITGLKLVHANPERVARLFAFGSNISNSGTIPGGSRKPTFVAFEARCKSEYQTLSATPEKWPQLLAGLRSMWRTMPDIPLRELSMITVPVTVSDGEHDEIIKRDHTALIARSIPAGRLVIQPGVSHFAMIQNAAQFSKGLEDFLNIA